MLPANFVNAFGITMISSRAPAAFARSVAPGTLTKCAPLKPNQFASESVNPCSRYSTG